MESIIKILFIAAGIVGLLYAVAWVFGKLSKK